MLRGHKQNFLMNFTLNVCNIARPRAQLDAQNTRTLLRKTQEHQPQIHYELVRAFMLAMSRSRTLLDTCDCSTMATLEVECEDILIFLQRGRNFSSVYVTRLVPGGKDFSNFTAEKPTASFSTIAAPCGWVKRAVILAKSPGHKLTLILTKAAPCPIWCKTSAQHTKYSN